jgi:hypothetical protein
MYLDDLMEDPCVYCYGKADTYEHILARSRGGPDGWPNIAPACRDCNNKKGDRTIIEMMMGWRWNNDEAPQHPRANHVITSAIRRQRRFMSGMTERVIMNAMHRVVLENGMMGIMPSKAARFRDPGGVVLAHQRQAVEIQKRKERAAVNLLVTKQEIKRVVTETVSSTYAPLENHWRKHMIINIRYARRQWQEDQEWAQWLERENADY